MVYTLLVFNRMSNHLAQYDYRGRFHKGGGYISAQLDNSVKNMFVRLHILCCKVPFQYSTRFQDSCKQGSRENNGKFGMAAYRR